MAVLGGEFAIVVLYSGTDDAITKVKEGSQSIESELGLTLFFKSTERHVPSGDARAYRLQVSGLDHPGIVHHITGILAQHEVNVDSLDTEVVYAPMAGTPTFVMRANLRVPGTVAIARLRDALCDKCDEENLDLLLEARV
jgi:glycine cleavage system transcriptional repressor